MEIWDNVHDGPPPNDGPGVGVIQALGYPAEDRLGAIVRRIYPQIS